MSATVTFVSQSEPGAGIKVRWAEFDRQCDRRGWKTDAERARQLGISHAHLTNMRANRANPGAKFIRRCLGAFGDNFYGVLFEEVEPTPGEAA